jgi:hypothetical protein
MRPEEKKCSHVYEKTSGILFQSETFRGGVEVISYHKLAVVKITEKFVLRFNVANTGG